MDAIKQFGLALAAREIHRLNKKIEALQNDIDLKNGDHIDHPELRSQQDLWIQRERWLKKLRDVGKDEPAEAV